LNKINKGFVKMIFHKNREVSAGTRRSFILCSYLAILTIATCVAVLSPSVVRAQMVLLSGVGSATYSEEATPKVKARALQSAKVVAFKKFMSRQPAARKSVYYKLQPKFMARLDDIIVEASIQKSKDDSENKKYTVLIQAKIDPTVVDALFDDLGSAGSKLTGTFGTFFLARVETSRQKYDVKRTKISGSKSANKIRETSVESRGKSLDAIEREKFSKKQSGGSAVVKRDKVVYAPNIELTKTLQEAIGEMLNNANFEVVEYTELADYGAPFLDELIETDEKFRNTGELSSRIKRKYEKAAKKAGWTYYGEGTISVGTAQPDPIRGNLKMSAQVTFKVKKFTKKGRKIRSKTIATVRKKTVSVSGDVPADMETDAANKAAKYAIDTVLGILMKRAIR
jgi:hypothetical protein